MSRHTKVRKSEVKDFLWRKQVGGGLAGYMR
jgi:hypothetical protein